MINIFPIVALLPFISAAVYPVARTCNPLLPSTYLSTAFTASRAQLNSYAKLSHTALIKYTDSANGHLGTGYWTSQNGWMNIAAYDKLRGTKDFERQVSEAQDALAKSTRKGTPLVNEYNDDAGWAALANLRAYEAYEDVKYFNRAIAVWEYLNTQCIDQKAIDKGYLEGTKNSDNKLAATCGGKSMIGGVYWVNGLPHHPSQASNAGVNAVSTGLFALLSAELCQITKDQKKYCTKAYTSAQWLDNHMVGPDGLLWDGLGGGSCKVTDWTFTYNTGLYISTYALLSSLTSNTTALTLAERTIKEALVTPGWHNKNGIIKEGAGPAAESNDGIGFRSVLIRGLYRSFGYLKDEQLKAAVLEYINIQYYGLTQSASDSKMVPVNYGRTWAGPFELSTSHAQLAAMDVINAITINPDSAYLKADSIGTPVIKSQARTGGC